MRARNIKPKFFVNSKLVALPPLVRLLFIGLWCMADRSGRLEDDVIKIKLSVLPGDQADVDTMLDQLKNSALILRYQVKGNRYIQVINFAKHQYPHIKEKDSTIPAPYRHGDKTIPARLNPESGILNPESGILNPHIAPSGANTVPGYAIPEKTKNPVGYLVMQYKIRKLGQESFDDRTWDAKHWSRSSAAAKDLLQILGGPDHAKRCLTEVADEFEKKSLSWTIETVVKWAHEWKARKGHGLRDSQRFLDALARQREDPGLTRLGESTASKPGIDRQRDMPALQAQTGADNGPGRSTNEIAHSEVASTDARRS